MIYKIKELLKKAGVEGDVLVSERPEFGDYSTSGALKLAREIKKSPMEIAKSLVEKIKEIDGGNLFEKVEMAPPGFVNLWLKKSALVEELGRILEKGLDFEKKNQKINLEFVSANPTGPLTMANGRGVFYGDVLANVLESVGYEVTREYYINDAGNQVRILGESVLAALGNLPVKEEYYQGDYIKELAQKLKIKKADDAETVGRLAAKSLLTQIKSSLKKAGIKFDVWFSEYQKLRKGGLVEKVLEDLEKRDLVAEHDGAKWLKTSEIADEKDRVLVKSDGQSTYFLSDIAYHYDKFINRKFDKAIDIWGADHHGYVARLKSGVKAIGVDPERLKIVITQLVRLVRGGEEVRMSKRKGEFVTMDELLQEVGKDAARFFFLLHAPETHMDFDLDLAKEKSLKNPVYYVQYAYVRMRSILEKTKLQLSNSKFENLKGESEMQLIKELIKFPDVVRQTAEDDQVSRLARYAMEVARAVHYFYEKERVIDDKGNVNEERLSLVVAAKEIMEKLFGVLGIGMPKKM